jgi:hypothetical protein
VPIFVIAQYGGCEGHSAPVQAFEREADARAALALAEQSSTTFRLYAVPVWPEPTKPWFQIEPLT